VSANPYEHAGRLTKAYKIATILNRGKITADEVRRMTEEHWEMVSSAAKVNLPSAETRAMVVRQLEKFVEPLDCEAEPMNRGYRATA
jgi:hypothetical protein